MTLDETILQKRFAEARRRFNHVPLKKCKSSSNVPTAAISMNDFEVVVNPDFITAIAGTEILSVEEALDASFDHEMGHFAYHPFSVERVIAEDIKARDFENGEEVRQFYDDVNDNLRVMLKNPESKIPELYRAMSPRTDLERVLLKFYEQQTGRNFGIGEISEELNPYVSELEGINFLNVLPNGRIQFVKLDEWRNLNDLSSFFNILKPLFAKLPEQQSNESQGNVQDSKGSKPESRGGENKDGVEGNRYKPNSPSPRDFSEGDIRKGLKKLVQEGIIEKRDIEKFVKDYGYKFESGSLPGGSYNNNPETFADRFLYESLAQRYKVRIQKTPIVSADGVYPVSLAKFKPEDSPLDFDPFSSMGNRILPGISNKWVRERISAHGHIKRTPDLCLLLDDSGSMPNPREEVSPAVVSSLAIAREYTKNKANVSVTLFSDRTKTFPATNEYDAIARNLLIFKKGNDTQVDLSHVPSIVGADYIVITDGRIGNREDVVNFLRQNAHRAYFVTIGNNSTQIVQNGVKYIGVSHPEDIGKIILDDIHRGRK